MEKMKDNSCRLRQSEPVRKYFDFGEPCSVCSESLEPNNRHHDIRCLQCFRIKCLNETCSEDNDCSFLKEKIKEEISDATNFISKKYFYRRQNEIKVGVQSSTSEKIHEVKVNTTISLSKWVGAIHRREESLTENCIRISIIGQAGKDDENGQEIYVRLDEIPEYQLVGLYEKGGTPIELNFIKSFEEKMASKAVKVSKTTAILEYLESTVGPAIIVCLHHSRIKEDIGYTLENIQEKYYSRLILVLLHFKIDDTDRSAAAMQQCFPNLRITDYFQHQERENMTEVIEKVIAIIFND